MKVYVLSSGEYSQRGVVAVYSSLAGAMDRAIGSTDGWEHRDYSGEFEAWYVKDYDIEAFELDPS